MAHSRYEPELGQAVFGNPTGRYVCPEYVSALLHYLLREIERVFWNREQREWDSYEEDPQIPGIEVRPYYWGSDEDEAKKPNFSFEDAEIRWYKHPNRGMSVNVDWDEATWCAWFDRALATIRAEDPIERGLA